MIPAFQKTAKLWRTLWSLRSTCDLPYELIVAEAKQSVAKNRLAGLEQATHDLVVMMDDDVLLPSCWASKLAFIYQRDETIGALSAMMTSPNGAPQNDLYNLAPGEVRDCRFPPGTCFLYSRERTAGCEFDPAYIESQWEDTDFMAQVQAKGLRTCATGAVHILHDNTFIREGERTPEKQRVWDHNAEVFNGKWGR